MLGETSIHFHYEEVKFRLSDPTEEKTWVLESIQSESMRCGELNFIFCSDQYLLKINQTYLKHDYYTDVITFNYNQSQVVAGDIFISIERVMDNARKHATSFINELRRVLMHGVLHLIGYNDKDSDERTEMRAKEDFYLTLHPLRKD